MVSTWPVTLSARQNVDDLRGDVVGQRRVREQQPCGGRSSTTSSGIRLAMRVPSTRPGATQFTVIVGAERHRQAARQVNERPPC